MSSRLLCSHNHTKSNHEPSIQFIPPGQVSSSNRYKCGSCCQYFSAICVLHTHLGGGSYHYDKDAMSAYPLDENGCPTLKYLNNEDRHGSYCDRCGDKVNTISKKRRRKKAASGDTTNAIHIKIHPEETDIGASKDNDTVRAGVDDEEDESEEPEPIEDRNNNVHGSNTVDNSMIENSGNCDETDINKTADNIDQANAVDRNKTGNGQQEVIPINNNVNRGYVNKEVTLNCITLETNEDGSVKLLLEEKDAAIFKTPHGEEIMKALKSQTKGMSLQNTQIVCSYSEPVDENIYATDNSLDEPRNTICAKRKSDEDFSVGTGKKRKKKYINSARKEAEELPGFGNTDQKGIEPVVFMIKHKSMYSEEAAVLLDECKSGLHDNRISKVQPLSAKGGEVYVVDMNALAHKKDIKFDKYIWRSYGNKKLPSYDPQINKHFFRLRLPNKTCSDDFQKHIIDSLHEDNNLAIIHYLGDETVFVPFPHGNSKRNRPFKRTCPSVLEELKTLSHTGLTPTQVLKVVSSSPMSGFKDSRVPRNFRQIKNHMYMEKKKGDRRTAGKNE